MSIENRANEIDVHVGRRVRKRRVMLGLSQTGLAKSIGITFQQIQKYEAGKNRIGAGRLFEISEILEVPVTFFYQELPRANRNRALSDETEQEEYINDSEINDRETLELVKAYHKILDSNLRKKLLETIKHISATLDIEKDNT